MNEELLKEHCFYTYASVTEEPGRFNFIGKANNRNFIGAFVDKYGMGPAVIWKCITKKNGSRDYRISISSDVFIKPNPKSPPPLSQISEFKKLLG